RMQILRELWDVRVSAETFSGKRVNFKDQMEQCKKGNFRYGVFIGENEQANGIVRVINTESGEEKQIKRESLVAYIQSVLQ
ncbi:hypothetical protein ENBRE01_3454, partial [Enteropsectra breve]